MYQNSNKSLLFKALASFSMPHFTKTLRITSGRQNRAQVWSWNLMLWKEIDQINSEHFKAELHWICLIGISVFLVVSDDLNWCRFSLKNYLTITKNMIPWNWHAFYRTKYSDEKCFFQGAAVLPGYFHGGRSKRRSWLGCDGKLSCFHHRWGLSCVFCVDMAVIVIIIIIDYGTYGLWGAILAGGETVVSTRTFRCKLIKL